MKSEEKGEERKHVKGREEREGKKNFFNPFDQPTDRPNKQTNKQNSSKGDDCLLDGVRMCICSRERQRQHQKQKRGKKK